MTRQTHLISRRTFAGGIALLPLAAFAQRATPRKPPGGEWIVQIGRAHV